MIAIENVTKTYATRKGKRKVLKNINLRIEKGEKVGILGRNGAGKSTLIRLISGVEQPTSGLVQRGMSVSWPLAFGGAFQGSLTGIDNLKFICRIYNVDINAAIAFTEEFSELGAYLKEPVKKYSSGMSSRLAFALSMAVEFDCFLIDEITAVGDSRFQQKCNYELFEKRKDRAIVMVSHEAHNIRQHCDRACVIHEGNLHDFPDVDSAYNYYIEKVSTENLFT
jgi:capsular polysaccharide transport system ATP-binding protein